MELDVGPTVGEADIGVRVGENLRHRVLVDIRGAFQEHGLQLLLDRQIQEGVDDAFALRLRHFANRFALPRPILGQDGLAHPDIIVPPPAEIRAGQVSDPLHHFLVQLLPHRRPASNRFNRIPRSATLRTSCTC